jgi:superfamily II DNA or RNA helicase
MKNIETELKNILKSRKLDYRDNFKRNILDHQKPLLPHVVAAATSSGKTYLAAAKFELYYKLGLIKKNERVLILASSMTILRDNFVEQFDKFGIDYFTYRPIENKKDLELAIKDKVQILITIPQTIEKHLKLIKNVKWMVVDEAHKWYFASTIKKINNELKPKYTMLLTGTPFKFNLRKDDYIIDYTSVRELYENNLIDNVQMKVLHSSIELAQMDYTSILGHLKESKSLNGHELTKSLNMVIKQLIQILKLRKKNWDSVNNISKNYITLFTKLEKSIIYTNGVNECDCIYECLRLNKVNCLRSHSKDEQNAVDTFRNFKQDDSIKVLVVVNRGKEGFNFPELYNIIDFSYTQDFATTLQMIGRLLRKSEGKLQKVFYKVAPKNTSLYFMDWMNYVIQLFDNEWYERYNGSNARQIRVPNELLTNNEDRTPRQNRGSRTTTRTFNPRNLEDTGMTSIEFMDQNKWFKSNDILSVAGSTSLGEIITKFFNLKKPKGHWTRENIIKESLRIDDNGERIYKTVSDFQKNCGQAYSYALEMNILYTDCKFIHQKNSTEYDEKTAIEKAKKYKNRTELAAKNRRLWDYLTENNLFDKAKKIEIDYSRPNAKSKNIDTKHFYNWCQENKVKSAKKFKKEGGYIMSYTTLNSNIPNFNWNDYKYKD